MASVSLPEERDLATRADGVGAILVSLLRSLGRCTLTSFVMEDRSSWLIESELDVIGITTLNGCELGHVILFTLIEACWLASLTAMTAFERVWPHDVERNA